MSTEIISPATVAVAWEASAPEAAFARLQGRRGIFWLDSSLRGGAGRFSLMGCEPFAVFRARGSEWEFRPEGGPVEAGRGDPWEKLEALFAMYRISGDRLEEPDAGAGPPFVGGAVGYVAYDQGAEPDIHLAWHDAAAIWDHAEGRAWLVGAGWRRSAREAAAELAGWLAGAENPPRAPAPSAHPSFRADFTREGYIEAVKRVRARIAAGEIYQMNLAQRFACPLAEPAPQLYRRLRGLNPAPMGAYLDTGDRQLLSSSPERFIEVQDRRIRTFPIKGTRPRGSTPEEDAARRRELVSSEKERAELLMIVDLLRNDLGRVCRFGSVRVRRLHGIESFATVHHLVGEVEGELRPDVGAAEIMRAVFPGGSITGAPKIRAMRAIAEEEPVARGIFSGSIGYFSACGRIDLNIAIRTIECRKGKASFHVGAGIVWDSDPAFEYEETLAKGKALFAALGGNDGPA